MGSKILTTELWTWGDTKYGQLGVGNLINKPNPQEVQKLKYTGIRKVVSGAYHSLAISLDRRVFTWGRNNFMQVAHCSQVDQKSPQLFTSNYFIQLLPDERAKDIAAGNEHSLILMNNKIFFMGKHK